MIPGLFLQTKMKNGRINKMKIAGFANCKIDFSMKVFRPRPETEFWVKKAVTQLAAIPTGKLQVLDIFAGTGCIGIAVLKNVKNANVDFVDIWPGAIKQIKKNLKLNKIRKTRYKIYRSDLFDGVKDKKYDFVFANPPYVALARINEVQKDVFKNDPKVALFAGKDGMVLIKKFFGQVRKQLKPKGRIFLEFDPFQKGEIAKIVRRQGLRVVFKKDQFEKYRWLESGIKY